MRRTLYLLNYFKLKRNETIRYFDLFRFLNQNK